MLRVSRSFLQSPITTAGSSAQTAAATATTTPPVKTRYLSRRISCPRRIWGFFSSIPCRFVGSPAIPVGPNHEVRYESLDFTYSDNENSNNNKTDLSGMRPEREGQEKQQKPQLHRIHHIAGFISSMYVAEYRTPLPPSLNRTFKRQLFLLDAGVPSDIARVETAMRQSLAKSSMDEELDDEHFLTRQLDLVFATHAHVDHAGGLNIWARRFELAERDGSKHIFTVPKILEQYGGKGGLLQYLVEVLGSNFYSWYLLRTFREFTWFNPFRHHPFVQPTVTGGSALPVFKDWVTIACPGHTSHMQILYHPLTQTVYVADLFLSQFGKYRTPIPVDRYDCYMQSLEMVKELPVKWLLMAHGGIVELNCNDPELKEKEEREAREEAEEKEAKRREKQEEQEEKEGEKKNAEQKKNKGKKKKRGAGDFLNQEYEPPARTSLDFKTICESVAERCKKAHDAEEKKPKQSLVLKVSRYFAHSSEAPKKFVWERDMILPEKQMQLVQAHIAVNTLGCSSLPSCDAGDNNNDDAVVVGKHINTYKATGSDSFPVD